MGWDVLMVKPYESNDDSLNEDKMYSFSKPEVIDVLKDIFNIKEIESYDWIDYENSCFAISFDLSSDKSIVLYTESFNDNEDELLDFIKNLSNRLNCRVFDTTEAEFII
ncbi:MAG: hypothetical protein IKJ82_04975 [Oscillospiraceae bacterium]|nr:hypothetical protein [Oscillospiraceae bacterium]